MSTKLLEEVKATVAELKQRVEDGLDTEKIEASIAEQVKAAVDASITPQRKSTWASSSSPVAGRDVKSVINMSPKYKQGSGYAAPQARNARFTDDVEEMVKEHDNFVISAMIMAKDRGYTGDFDTPKDVAWACQQMKSLPEFQERFGEMAKALDTATSAEGTEFIPTGLSADLIDRVRVNAAVASLFPQFKMPQNPFKFPGKAIARTKSGIIAENTTDSPSKVTATTPGTRDVTFSATKLGQRVLWSMELNEDSIVAVAPFIREEIIEGTIYAIEDAIINGDTAGTHQDTDTAAGAATLAAKAWLGLRAHAQDNSDTHDLSTFSLDNLRNMRKAMGVYGAQSNQLAWIVSVAGLIEMLKLDEVLTLDKLGPQATVLTGQLGVLDGAPVVVSEEMRDDVDANGVNGASGNTKSNLILVNRRAWMLGNHRDVTVKSQEDIETDTLVSVVTMRADFQRMHGTTGDHTRQGYNFS